MTSKPDSPAGPTAGSPRLRDAFPCLFLRLAGALSHVMVLPRAWSRAELLAFARAQIAANRLRGLLALSAEEAIGLSADGEEAMVAPPACVLLVVDRLRPVRDLPESLELGARRAALAAYMAARRGGGYVLGDLTKGARPATAEERRSLAGRQPGGAPRGLVRCPDCGEWRGECLDRNAAHGAGDPPPVVRVHCTCENENRCAACGRPLHRYRLNSNFYDPRDRAIWHVPGFVAVDHRCPDDVPAPAP